MTNKVRKAQVYSSFPSKFDMGELLSDCSSVLLLQWSHWNPHNES